MRGVALFNVSDYYAACSMITIDIKNHSRERNFVSCALYIISLATERYVQTHRLDYFQTVIMSQKWVSDCY